MGSSPFTYAAFTMMAAQVVLVPLGKEMRDEHMLSWGGFGLALFFYIIIRLSRNILLRNSDG
ncbi:hypothetical protein DCC39_17770 [Pueribacillus theae]|uniref:Uncharacterized protein n=2 Tax=Pueribacillus theae TaxID=2171751 RepID=A0A2U1JLI8_9BACI|nr:hypothetical protein DCC39_17770 [Pueribacillus theae]